MEQAFVENHRQDRPWAPGGWRRFPISGSLALVGAVLCVCGSAAVLILSNGKPIDAWSVQPTVFLSIIATTTNILLRFSLAQGVAITWWLKSLQKDTTVGDLHRYWDHGSSLKAAIVAGKHLSKIAIACILVALCSANGPLLQRATRVTVSQSSSDVMFSLQVANSLPIGYTGYLSGRGLEPAVLTSNFTSVLSEFNSHSPATVEVQGCKGICATTVQGAGFAVNCSSYSVNYSVEGASEDDNPEQFTRAVDGFTSFDTTFAWEPDVAGLIGTNVQFKQSSGCVGQVFVHNCTLREAQVEYQVLVNGNDSSISLHPNSTIWDDNIIRLVSVPFENMEGSSSTFGGMVLALQGLYESSSHFRWIGAAGYELIPFGSLTNQFLRGYESAFDCNIYWTDPTPYLLSQIRELMFRTSVQAGSGNSSYTQQVVGAEIATSPAFQSNYTYLIVSASLVILTITSIALTFNGYWHFGRSPSLSPVAVAKACQLPVMGDVDSNATVDEIVQSSGHRRIRYGAMHHATDPNGEAKPYMGYEDQMLLPGSGEAVLAFGDPARVVYPSNGVRYRGQQNGH